MLGAKASPEAVKSWNRLHGYDRPEIVQFFSYLGNIAHLNFGYSYKLSQSVTALFKENAGRSAYLTLAALVLALIIAIPLGIAQAVRRNTLADYTVTSLNFMLYSMPSFFLGLILIQIFALDLHIFPPTVSDEITTDMGGDHPSAAADAADRHAGRHHRRLVQPLHALLGPRQPRPGLHPAGARQGPVRARRAVPPSAAQRLPADDHARSACRSRRFWRATC